LDGTQFVGDLPAQAESVRDLASTAIASTAGSPLYHCGGDHGRGHPADCSPIVEVLQRLTTQFGTLRVELESHEMQGAADSLSRVAEQVFGLAAARWDQAAAVDVERTRVRCGRRTAIITRGYRLHGGTSFPIRCVEFHTSPVRCSS